MENKILISTEAFGEFDRTPLDLLQSSGLCCILNPYKRRLNTEETIELAKEAVGIVAGVESLDDGVLQKLLKLKVISRCGTGLDNVDLQAAEKRRIRIFNTPDAPTRAVAELSVGLILNLLRKVSRSDRLIRSGGWLQEVGEMLYAKRAGIIGFGRIGRTVAELLRPFACEIAYSDPNLENGVMGLRRLPLKELLAWADIILVHVSGKNRLLGEEQLRLIRKGAWLVNLSRGGVVDEDALYNLLEQRHLRGCALDVFEQEPYQGQLRELDNVILTPHIGSYAREARVRMETEAVQNLLRGLEDIYR